jgi:excisionase family DNA binding protein
MLGISLRTAQMWTESGLLEAWKTEGGHRRISRESVERLLANPSVQSLVPSVANRKAVVSKAEVASETPLKILVVEDEPNLQRLYAINMRSWSIKPEVSTALDGYEALVKVGRGMPDLLVTDLHMPGMDGFRMLNVLYSMPELSGMKIVIVSGLSAQEIKERGGIPVGVDLLPKPIPFDQLRAIAEELVAVRQSNIQKELA